MASPTREMSSDSAGTNARRSPPGDKRSASAFSKTANPTNQTNQTAMMTVGPWEELEGGSLEYQNLQKEVQASSGPDLATGQEVRALQRERYLRSKAQEAYEEAQEECKKVTQVCKDLEQQLAELRQAAVQQTGEMETLLLALEQKLGQADVEKEDYSEVRATLEKVHSELTEVWEARERNRPVAFLEELWEMRGEQTKLTRKTERAQTQNLGLVEERERLAESLRTEKEQRAKLEEEAVAREIEAEKLRQRIVELEQALDRAAAAAASAAAANHDDPNRRQPSTSSPAEASSQDPSSLPRLTAWNDRFSNWTSGVDRFAAAPGALEPPRSSRGGGPRESRIVSAAKEKQGSSVSARWQSWLEPDAPDWLLSVGPETALNAWEKSSAAIINEPSLPLGILGDHAGAPRKGVRVSRVSRGFLTRPSFSGSALRPCTSRTG